MRVESAAVARARDRLTRTTSSRPRLPGLSGELLRAPGLLYLLLLKMQYILKKRAAKAGPTVPPGSRSPLQGPTARSGLPGYLAGVGTTFRQATPSTAVRAMTSVAHHQISAMETPGLVLKPSGGGRPPKFHLARCTRTFRSLKAHFFSFLNNKRH